MIFEFIGLGIMVPLLGLVVSDDFLTKYSILNNFIQDIGKPSKQQILTYTIIIMLVFYLFKTFFLLYSQWSQAKFNSSITKQLQIRLYKGYLNLPYEFHLDRNSSMLLNNIQSEVNYLSHVTQAFMAILADISLIIGVFFMLLFINLELALSIVILFSLFAYLLNVATRKKMNQIGIDREFHESLMFKNVLQGLGSIKDVILSGRKEYFVEMFNYHAKQREKVFVSQGVIVQIPKLYYELLSIFIIAMIVLYFVYSSEQLTMLLPTIGLFMLASLRIMPSINKLSLSFQTIRFATPVIDKLYTELKLLSDYENKKGNQSSEKLSFEKNISVKGLCYSYPGKGNNALLEIDIEILKGQTIGFLGPSGSGKSTLIDLIIGILKPDKGTIFVDGKNIQTNLRKWQNLIGYVPQTITLLDDSIRKNIAFGIPETEIDDEKIKKSIKLANLSSFIFELKEGTKTPVGERGVKLSGGQRQRIGLARALYNDPPVLVLDEATSALDKHTEDEVMQAIRELKGNKTILIIAHRTSTIAHCDLLFMIDRGSIAKAGPPVNFSL
jgi:ABC-type multidrug transport system fused ATPase/permease subunit